MARRVEFDANNFAEGRFRRAYMGTWISPSWRKGQLCVVKELKDNYTWQASDWDTTKLIQEEAQGMAEGFNAYSRSNYPINFTKIDVMPVISQSNPNRTPKLGEYVVVEDYIEGTFKKWCNNYGFISQEAKSTAISMPAFMHWSWYHTKGQMMIADLQGVKQPDGYLLTDPVILSDDGQYGCTDMGVEGMAMFFTKHNCNAFCKKLPAPEFHDFVGVIPGQTLLMCKTALQSIQNSTAYRLELRFPNPVKKAVLHTFRNIATRI